MLPHTNRQFNNTSTSDSTAKNNPLFMKRTFHTLSDKVLYDDASLYAAYEEDKLYFNFKRKPYLTETYNVLEAVAIMMTNSQWDNLSLWNVSLSELDKEVASTNVCLYWLCHVEEMQVELKFEWKNCVEKVVLFNRDSLNFILKNATTLADIRDGFRMHLNFDLMYSKLLAFSA